MTDKEILQGIDRLDAELPFDEVCVGGKDNWHDIDVHELLYEVRERIKEWHYPSKGEYPTEDGLYFVACRSHFESGDNYTDFCHYKVEQERWINFFGHTNPDVYAWMPLPEPYKIEREET